MKIKLNNDLKELQRLAESVEQFGEENNLQMKDIFDVNLALDELITNIISYGYGDGSNESIDLEIIIDNDELKILIEDNAKEFDPFEKEDPIIDIPLEEKKVGGLGIFFVKQKMDKYSYKRENGKNKIELIKKIKSN